MYHRAECPNYNPYHEIRHYAWYENIYKPLDVFPYLTTRKQKFAHCEWPLYQTAAGYKPNEVELNWALRSTVPYLAKMALLVAMW